MIEEKIDEIAYRINILSKRNLLKIITICFWIYMIISLIFIVRNGFQEEGWEEAIVKYSTAEITIKFVIYAIESLILNNILVILIYIAMRIGIKKYKKDKLSAIDFKRYEGYYRDILKDHSPAELSYIDDFEISYKDDIVATLLSLKLKHAISFNEAEEKIIIENPNTINLFPSEEYILRGIDNNGKLKFFSDDNFKTKVIEDAKNNETLKLSKSNGKSVTHTIIFSAFLMIILIAIVASIIGKSLDNPAYMDENMILIVVLVTVLIINIPIATLVYIVTYIMKHEKNKNIRTKKGETINERLEGLKNYLKDYSYLDSKDEQSIIVWEEYLIYSVIFRQNTEITKSVWSKYVNHF